MRSLDVEKMYIDKMSGKSRNRPKLKEMLDNLKEGDTVVVESISRLARSTRDLFYLLDKFQEKGVDFVSQKESFDTSNPQGKFMLTIFAAVAELERDQTEQRQKEGIAAMPVVDGKRVSAKTGRGFGRPKQEIDSIDLKDGETVVEACARLGISRSTYHRRMREAQSCGLS
jgi:DNA invertase Pin-like site-specific DNA recombinase